MVAIKNSKKGFSLPLAMGVTAVLVLLSASLIFIASNSISNTSQDLSSRQAYLNVKSALDYAKAYYGQITDFGAIGTDGPTAGSRVEYMAMKDVGGTTNEGADLSASSAITDAAGVQTYVVAEYNPAEGANPATLKLTAYSRYADAFGRKGQRAHLTVTYNINRTDDSIITDPNPGVQSGPGVSSDDGITLKIKKHPDMDWAFATYIWTYEDKSHIYTGLPHYQSFDVSSTVDQINNNEKSANESNPGGKWINGFGTGDTRNGPATSAVGTGGDWYENTFYTNSKDVHYFNVIISRRGGMLSSGTTDVQSCEMFHLWYLDPRDKKIYFEIKKPHMYYYTSTHWDGKKNIETFTDASGNWIDDPTVLVYVKNPKTTVHVNFVNGDESSSTTSLTSAPVVNNVLENGSPLSGKSYIHSGNKYQSGITMQYEGCGWWVANIESGGNFSMEIPYNGASRGVTVGSYTDREAWIVYDNASGTFSCYSSEEAACEAAGISKTSYVTVHAKGFTSNETVQTYLSYRGVGIYTSDERMTLINKINEANTINADDFDDASYAVLAAAVAEGTDIYNDINYISNAPGPRNSQKIEQAANGYTKNGVTYIGYKKATSNIQDAIEGLTPKTIDTEQYNTLNTLIATANNMVNTAGVYDYGKLSVFSSGPLTAAKTALADANCTASQARTAIDNLTSAIETLNNTGKLDKSVLQALIDESNPYITDTNYEAAARNTFKTVHEEAVTLINKPQLLQTEIDAEVTTLTEAFNILKAAYTTPLNTADLDSVMASALAFINSSPTQNFTTEGYNNLVAAYNNAQAVKTSASVTQEQIDEQTAAVSKAFNECIIQKPANGDDTLVANGQMKIYVSTPVAFDLRLTKSGTTDESRIPFSNFTLDVTNNLYFATIDRTRFDAVEFVYVDSTGTDVSTGATSLSGYTDGNMLANLSLSGSSFQASYGKLTTLYFEKSKFNTAPEVTLNGTAAQVVSEDSYHYAVRFIYADGINVAVNYDGETTSAFTAKAGQWVVLPENNNPVSVSLIHPIYETSSGARVPQPTTSAATGSADVQLLAFDDRNITFNTVAFNKVPSSSDNCIIIIDMSYSVNRDKYMPVDVPPYIFPYQAEAHGSGTIKHILVANEPGIKMQRYETTDYYFAEVPKSMTHFDISYVTNASNPSSPVTSKFNGLSAYSTGEIKITSKTNYYTILWNTSTGNYIDGSYQFEQTNTAPTLRVPDIDTDDLTGDSLTMPFVGGKRVRIVNRSYTADYSGKKDSNGNSFSSGFGGTVHGNECNGRVGNSELKPYYDWCEFKIPVAQSSTYSLEIKGLNNTTSSTRNVTSQQVAGATGDVWVTLASTHQTSGKYDDINVYTFDPDADENSVGDTSRVYFDVPSGWNAGSLNITTSGVGGSNTVQMTNHLSRFSSYYYYDVNNKTPFIIFTINDGTGATHVYKTSVQGGSKVLFNPLLDNSAIEGGKGAWVSFVSDQNNLKDMVVKAQSFYYGRLLIKEYDSEGNAANANSTNYKYPNALRTVYTAYTTAGSASATDDTVNSATIMAMDDASAYSNYQQLKAWVDAYENLYGKMTEARAYIKYPVSMAGSTPAGRYTEYLHRGNTETYTTVSLNNLRNRLIEAESVYEDSGSTPASLNTAAARLTGAMASIEVDDEGSITLIFYDAQEIITDTSVVKVFYDGCPTGGVAVDDLNEEDFPIVHVDANDDSVLQPGKRCIKNVYFTVNGVQRGPVQAEIYDQDIYVMLDTTVNAKWAENSKIKYVFIRAEEFVQSGDALVFNLVDKDGDGEEDPMAISFKKNVAVRDSGGSLLYEIKAGVYNFRKGDAALGGGITLDIFSTAAKSFFTNSESYGVITGAQDSESAGWTTSGKIKSTGTYGTVTGDMNFIANSGVLSNNYVSRLYADNSGTLYFRWDSENQLVVGRPVTFAVDVPSNVRQRNASGEYIPSIVFASVGEVASNTIGPELLFAANSPTANEMIVRFTTNTKVHYKDINGEHKFIIYAGDYLITKKDTSTSYIANLFDRTYWKGREFVKPLSDSTSGEGETSLSGGTYSN